MSTGEQPLSRASSSRKLLVTSALPYANGPIHLGHLVEYIQTDIWVRFQKLMGHTVAYMCADDTHGTPIMMNARKQGITPEALINRYYHQHVADFNGFSIDFDHFGSTHTDENRQLSEMIFKAAMDTGAIETREIDQLYSETSQIFLPDRFVKGECPTCGTPDQYGDSCEVCSATYSPMDLKNPVSAIEGDVPVVRSSLHYFFKLSQFQPVIEQWLSGDVLAGSVKNKLKEWLESGLKDWDISRDAPYFGFTIPGTDNKFFYVWVDAPVGYISTSQIWGNQHGVDYRDIWTGTDWEIHHFIGKDIVYFHTLFWPAMLDVAGLKKPTRVNVHGFLTVNGEKMSKSRGTFILARTYLDHSDQLNPEFLRYYYASKLSSAVEDIDLNLDDFVLKVNSDVVNKVVNIASRLGSIVNKKCGGRLTTCDPAGAELLDGVRRAATTISSLYEAVEFRKAMMDIMQLADKANAYIDGAQPWSVVKEDPDKAAQICTTGLNVLRYLMVYLKPVLPVLVGKLESFLTIEPLTWASLDTVLEAHPIGVYEHVAKRVEPGDVACLVTQNA